MDKSPPTKKTPEQILIVIFFDNISYMKIGTYPNYLERLMKNTIFWEMAVCETLHNVIYSKVLLSRFTSSQIFNVHKIEGFVEGAWRRY